MNIVHVVSLLGIGGCKKIFRLIQCLDKNKLKNHKVFVIGKKVMK